MDALLELARKYPLAVAAVCTGLLAALAVGLARMQQSEEDAEEEGNAEALAYLREHGEPMPGWSIPFTLEELEEITSSGTLRGRPVRFNIRNAELLRDYLRKQQQPRE